MNSPAEQIESFRQFAEDELNNHIQELQTNYQNRGLASEELKQQAYAEHEEIYNKELSDKIDELITDSNQFLKPALKDLKDKFVEKLKPSNSLSSSEK
ncbi:MAG: hypothetical protein ABI691_15125 [Ginsengibacter sp.]